VVIDKFTKWIEVKPVTCPKADRVLDFLDELIHRYGLPHRIITDLGSNFNNYQFWEYCENSKIDVRYVSVAHPRTNGQVERANGMVLDALKKAATRRCQHQRRQVDQGTTQCALCRCGIWSRH
jgi:predicted methyltransferase